MVLVNSAPEPTIYYKEVSSQIRESKFCLKHVQTLQPRTEKRADAINVQIVRGKTNSFIQLDEDEAKKVQGHGDAVLKKLQKVHKSVIWNFIVGRSFVDKISKGSKQSGCEEVNLDYDENLEFDPINPKTWSDESFDFVKSILKASEFNYDGYCVLFCVNNDQRDPDVDFDEVAWELEKCLIYHFLRSKSQIIMNEEAAMNRRGLDPVSRKTKTPGRKKSGFCVYLAYQLWDSVNYDQMVGESINRGVDLGVKKKQLVASLNEAKLAPQNDERVRKGVKEIREFLPREQLELVEKMRQIQDPKSVEMLAQFVSLIQNGRPGDRTSGLMGLPQFLTFLNKTQEETSGANLPESGRRSSSRMSSITSPRVPVAIPKYASSTTPSTLPRPTRKSSVATSQTYSMSSRSTTPDTPRKNAGIGSERGRRPSSQTQSSLASIPSSGSASSTPETLRRQEHGPSMRSSKSKADELKRKSGLPKRANPTSPAISSRPVPSPRGTRGHPSNGGSSTVSPSASSTNSPRRTAGAGPIPEGRITREDLRRMNKSYPSGAGGNKSTTSSASKKPPSFSRTSIPMS